MKSLLPIALAVVFLAGAASGGPGRTLAAEGSEPASSPTAQKAVLAVAGMT